MARWEKAKTREVPLMEKLGAWFLDNMPVSPPPVLVHNDFYLHNIMVGAVNHGEIVGVFYQALMICSPAGGSRHRP